MDTKGHHAADILFQSIRTSIISCLEDYLGSPLKNKHFLAILFPVTI